MTQVTIVGSTSPCVELPRGERRRVQHTDHVQRLIDGGFVEVVEWHDESEARCVCGEPDSPGVVHRTDGPCYHKEPEPVDKRTETERIADEAALQARRELGLTKPSYAPEEPDDEPADD